MRPRRRSRGPVFPADAVITFTAPKPAHVFGQLTRRWDQPVVVAPIGSPEEAIVSALGLDWAGSALALAQTPRAAGGEQGQLRACAGGGRDVWSAGGKVGRAGDGGTGGAARRRGLVTAAVPAPVLALVAAVAPELMTWPLAANAAGCDLRRRILRRSGCGADGGQDGAGDWARDWGRARRRSKFTTGLLAATKIPAVIDADALNILAAKPVLLAKLAKGRTLVLTPHPGEMARLAGMTVAEVQANRLEVARELCRSDSA